MSRGSGHDDPANHDLNDDNGVDPVGHDANDDNGVDPVDHDANDDRSGPGAGGDNGNGNGNGGGPGPSGPGGGEDHSGPPLVTAETLTATALGSRLEGDKGDDSLVGGAGNDRLEGNDGADTINGGAGDDLIRGGKGPDVLTGGAGDDTFRIDSGAKTLASLDRITDFTHGHDKLVFDDAPAATAANFTTDTAADFATALAHANAALAGGTTDYFAVQVGADVIVFADAANEHHVESAVVLTGHTLADIAPADIG